MQFYTNNGKKFIEVHNTKFVDYVNITKQEFANELDKMLQDFRNRYDVDVYVFDTHICVDVTSKNRNKYVAMYTWIDKFFFSLLKQYGGKKK